MLLRLPLFLSASLVLGSPALALEILPHTKDVPVVDGVIRLEEWKEALVFNNFTSSTPTDQLQPTKSYLTTDGTYLYIAFQCEEPKLKSIVTKTIADEKDGAVWQDDSVEIFLDAGNTGRLIYHLIVNSQGTYYDSQINDLKPNAAAWSSEAQVRTGQTTKGWEVEIALPLTSLRHLLSTGELLGINLARNRFAGGGDRPQNSSIAGGHYGFPERFTRLLVGGPVRLPEGGYVITNRAGPFLHKEGGKWEFEVSAKGNTGGELQFVFTGSGAKREEKRTLQEGRAHFSFPFTATEAKAMQECEIFYGQQPLAKYIFEVIEPAALERIARTESPLFQSLLEPIPDGLSSRGYVLWTHLFPQSRERLPDFWLRTAQAQTNEQVADWFKQQKAIRMTRASWYSTSIPERVTQRERYLRKGVEAMVDIRLDRPHMPKEIPIGISHSQPWYLDPRFKFSILNNAQYVIEASAKYRTIQWLSAGDETWEVMHRNLIHFLDQRASYPQLDAVDAEIRDTYGFGKYGLPLSSTDTNPFRWIATRRWEVDKMISLMAEIKGMIKEKAPHLKFMSWDNISGHRPYGLHRWSEVFDIITGQLYPARTPERQVFTFLTHWYRDLTGTKELWPVPHYEHYAANFTKEETEELFSQVYRGGATGLHLYLADTIGDRRGKASSVEDSIGAPERWAVASSVVKRIHEQPFQVKRAPADTGIFYSNTSYAGQGVGSGRALMYTNEVEWIYTLLGPKLHGAIRFLDEQIATRTADVLKGLKTVYLPYGPIMDNLEHDALEAFVRGGGTLVICDPLAFRHRSDGSERKESPLLPRLKSGSPGVPQMLTVIADESPLPAVNASYSLQVPGEAQVLARYADGEAAILSKSLGKGTVICFGTNPLVERTIKEAAWTHFFSGLQKTGGAVAKDEMWRFRFPSPPLPERERPEGLCLTANYFEWSYSEPRARHNSRKEGSYQISRRPDTGDESPDEAIPFTQGRLTDRIRGAQADNKAKGADYILTWHGPEPLDIEWKFAPSAKPKLARIFYRGALPAGQCEVYDNAQGEWKKLAGWKQPEPLVDVGLKVLNIPLPHDGSSRTRLRFEPEAEDEWTIAEVEWWGLEP